MSLKNKLEVLATFGGAPQRMETLAWRASSLGMQSKGTLATAEDWVNQLADTGERLLTDNFNENTIEHLHRYAVALHLCRDKDVLDVASGEGYGSGLIAGVARTILGVDISGEAVSRAKAKYRMASLDFIEGSASDLPLESSVMDVVVSFETIEHHEDHAEMMAEIKRVLRPGGVLIISSPDKLNYADLPNTSNPFHVKELYKEEFHSLVKEYFDNVEMLSQRLVYGSLIAPEDSARGFAEFWGDHYHVYSSANLGRSMYNVCLASDSELPLLPVSLYDGWQVIDVLRQSLEQQRQKDLKALLASPSYRLGRTLTWPLRKLFGK